MDFQTTTNAGLFLKRELEQRLPKLYEKRYPMLWGMDGSIIPMTADLDEGTQSIIEETVATAGEAAIYTDGSNDIPVVDATINESSFKVASIINSFQYTVMELNAAAKAGRPINQVRLSAMNRGLIERAHKLAVFGDARQKMTGLLNNSLVPTVASSYTPLTASVDDHISFVADNMTKVETDSNLVEAIDTIVVPAKLFNVWAKARLDNNVTVIQHLLANWGAANGGSLRRILKVNEVQSAILEANGVMPAGTNKDRVLFLPANPDAIEMKYYSTRYMEPQLQGMTYRTIAYQGQSEVISHYPQSMLYVDISKL